MTPPVVPKITPAPEPTPSGWSNSSSSRKAGEISSAFNTRSNSLVVREISTSCPAPAALRTAYYVLNGKNPDPDLFKVVRGMEGIKEAEVEIAGIKIKAAIVSGLGNTRKLMERIQSGEAEYHFVEVMACPGGCVGGGGQPITDGVELADVRGRNLYKLDKKNPLRFSHENPSVIKAYEDFFEKPLSHKSHELLHTDHEAWKMPNQR